eukprot:5147057-Amphidinium_carterae.2
MLAIVWVLRLMLQIVLGLHLKSEIVLASPGIGGNQRQSEMRWGKAEDHCHASCLYHYSKQPILSTAKPHSLEQRVEQRPTLSSKHAAHVGPELEAPVTPIRSR